MGTRTMAAAAALAIGLGASLPTPVGAQAAPTITATPLVVQPGETVSVVATCDTVARVQALSRYEVSTNSFPPFQTLSVVEGPPGTWTGTYVADHDPEGDGVDDVSIRNFCELRDQTSVTVDVEDPALRFGAPRGDEPVWPTTDDPTLAFGTDCPAGSSVAVVVAWGDEEVALTAPLDERGDWVVDLPAAPEGATQTVTASCGDLTYDPISRAVPTEPTTATTTTTAAATTTTAATGGGGTTPPPPPPAVARPGSASYAG